MDPSGLAPLLAGWTSPSRGPLPPVRGIGAARQGAVSSREADEHKVQDDDIYEIVIKL
jgi:hypothetical protein